MEIIHGNINGGLGLLQDSAQEDIQPIKSVKIAMNDEMSETLTNIEILWQLP